MNQQVFNPVKFGFEWTNDGWYTFDRQASMIAARKARDEAAKAAKASGKQVKKFSMPNQLVSMGGIGSGRPHIEEVVTCYGFNAY